MRNNYGRKSAEDRAFEDCYRKGLRESKISKKERVSERKYSKPNYFNSKSLSKRYFREATEEELEKIIEDEFDKIPGDFFHNYLTDIDKQLIAIEDKFLTSNKRKSYSRFRN